MYTTDHLVMNIVRNPRLRSAKMRLIWSSFAPTIRISTADVTVEIEVGNSEKHLIRYEKHELSGADKVFVDGELIKERKVIFMSYKNSTRHVII